MDDWAGTPFNAGASGLTVKHCLFENVNLAIFSNWAGSSNFTILDNTFIGRDDPRHLMGWSGEFWKQFAGVDGQAFPPKLDSYTAVRIYGGAPHLAHHECAAFPHRTALHTHRT